MGTWRGGGGGGDEMGSMIGIVLNGLVTKTIRIHILLVRMLTCQLFS